MPHVAIDPVKSDDIFKKQFVNYKHFKLNI